MDPSGVKDFSSTPLEFNTRIKSRRRDRGSVRLSFWQQLTVQTSATTEISSAGLRPTPLRARIEPSFCHVTWHYANFMVISWSRGHRRKFPGPRIRESGWVKLRIITGCPMAPTPNPTLDQKMHRWTGIVNKGLLFGFSRRRGRSFFGETLAVQKHDDRFSPRSLSHRSRDLSISWRETGFLATVSLLWGGDDSERWEPYL